MRNPRGATRFPDDPYAVRFSDNSDYIMEKYIYNEQNGLWYELQGVYYIPCLELPAEKEERHVGVRGQRHLRYIRKHKKVFYSNLLISGKLQSYLADIDKQAEELYHRLIEEMADRQGVTEKFKADQPMEWIGKMNNIQA